MGGMCKRSKMLLLYIYLCILFRRCPDLWDVLQAKIYTPLPPDICKHNCDCSTCLSVDYQVVCDCNGRDVQTIEDASITYIFASYFADAPTCGKCCRPRFTHDSLLAYASTTAIAALDYQLTTKRCAKVMGGMCKRSKMLLLYIYIYMCILFRRCPDLWEVLQAKIYTRLPPDICKHNCDCST